MPNTVLYTLFLHCGERLADLCLVVEGLLVDEGAELGLPVVGLDLGEDHLDGLEHVGVRHVPNGLNVEPLVLFFHFGSLVHSQVV